MRNDMEKNKGGRPLKQIPQDEFEKLCALQCTKEEICGFFNTTDKTLESWCKRTYKKGFSEIFREKRGTGKISLRRMQFQLAKKSAAMAIFLGKNWLGQTDKGQGTEDTEDDGFMDALKESADVWDE
uniref:DNA-packaging protein small subunit n=1 Tax=Myoviridae sp. ctk6V34 TaxID=2825164 RepID=A0A8S5V405_9CAUD|nr:MAG TPA: DNA-packaging protein small subunit [Myoviridae sp. ctk6V34]